MAEFNRARTLASSETKRKQRCPQKPSVILRNQAKTTLSSDNQAKTTLSSETKRKQRYPQITAKTTLSSETKRKQRYPQITKRKQRYPQKPRKNNVILGNHAKTTEPSMAGGKYTIAFCKPSSKTLVSSIDNQQTAHSLQQRAATAERPSNTACASNSRPDTAPLDAFDAVASGSSSWRRTVAPVRPTQTYRPNGTFVEPEKTKRWCATSGKRQTFQNKGILTSFPPWSWKTLADPTCACPCC